MWEHVKILSFQQLMLKIQGLCFAEGTREWMQQAACAFKGDT